MPDWNAWSVVIVLILFLMWKLEFVATLWDRKSEPASVPVVLEGVMTQSELERGKRYRMEVSRIGICQSAFELSIILVFWAAGGFEALDGWARMLLGDGIPAGLCYLSLWFLANALFALPFEIYKTFVVEHRYGFNRSTPRTFLMDRIKGLMLAGVIGLPVLALLLWILGEVSQAWWWAWVVLAGFQWLLVWLSPTWILPLFNRFTPMEKGLLRRAIEELGARCGFPLDGVFVMDGSKRSTKANAFFTGIGRHKKIALYDTLIDRCSQDEVVAVLAHEIGHFRCGHIRSRLMAGMVNLGVMCFLLGLCTDPTRSAARTVFDAFGVDQISPHVGLVLFGILISPVSLVVGVGLHAWSRRHEWEADAYAKRVVGTGRDLASALCRMTKDHLAHPSPSGLRVWLDHSHPPLIQRLQALSAGEVDPKA